jgi:hypothetical protein
MLISRGFYLSKDFDLEFEKLLQESARVAAEFDASEDCAVFKAFQLNFRIFPRLNIANYN